MKIINPNEFEVVPWKNGLGSTKQIAISDDTSYFWRMSIADVVKNSQFSRFPGLHRVLTVIDGNGMNLLSEDKTLKADFEKPLTFSGDISAKSQLRQGAIKNFNLIYDAHSLDAEVSVVKDASKHTVEPALVSAAYVLHGQINTNHNQTASTGTLLLISKETIHLSLSTKARVLVIRLTLNKRKA